MPVKFYHPQLELNDVNMDSVFAKSRHSLCQLELNQAVIRIARAKRQ